MHPDPSVSVGGMGVALFGTGLTRTGTIPAGAVAGAAITAMASATAGGTTISDSASEEVEEAAGIIAPRIIGSIADRIWTQGFAIAPINVASVFTGTDLAYTLAPTSAPLPAGLSLSSAGVISGAPTATPSGTLRLRATNTVGYADVAFGFAVEATGTVTGTPAVTAFATDQMVYDVGAVLGRNAAILPLAGTGDNGKTVRARAVRASDGVPVTDWMNIGVVASGAWSGSLAGVPKTVIGCGSRCAI